MAKTAEQEELFPHVSEEQLAIIDRFEEKLNNTGGNDPRDLLNDFNTPNSRLMTTNIVRFTLAMGVYAQVTLLMGLVQDGDLS